MHALKCCINEASLCFCHGAVFIRLFSEDHRQSNPAERKGKMKSLPSAKTRDQARLSPWCCDKETVPRGHMR